MYLPLIQRQWGPGEEERFSWGFPSPQPSPRSCLAGRGRRGALAGDLNSTAVGHAQGIPRDAPGCTRRRHGFRAGGLPAGEHGGLRESGRGFLFLRQRRLASAQVAAKNILSFETELARASRKLEDLRDPERNPNKKFAFYHRVLSGQKEPRPRGKEALDAEEGAMGMVLGKIFVQEYLPARSKARYTRFVEAFREAYRDRIRRLDWMSDVHALAKWRVLGPLANIPKFHEAFGVRTNQPLWRPPEARVRIW